MFHAVAGVLLSTPFFIAGAAGYCGLVDVSTQFTEYKYKKSVADEAAKKSRERGEPVPEEEEWELDRARTARMTGLGLVSGIFSIGFFSLVNAAVGGERSFGNAMKKALVGSCLIGPPMFVLQLTANELLVRGHFRTAWPKIKQEFPPSCALSLVYLPFSVLGFYLFESPVLLILFNAPISFVFNMGMNFLLNRKLSDTSASAREQGADKIATAEQPAASPVKSAA
eukprot:TRINITY_DN8953_c0_g1_i1.p3 TRINITY_DN8953_c0_g1~~TRINITY_DN8953_c0_g1_i1.p3  ORF type:complete len:226 (+),score=31.23 TRINITY_DN8953_c0_g1_i1:46-723(+)